MNLRVKALEDLLENLAHIPELMSSKKKEAGAMSAHGMPESEDMPKSEDKPDDVLLDVEMKGSPEDMKSESDSPTEEHGSEEPGSESGEPPADEDMDAVRKYARELMLKGKGNL